MSSQIQLTGPHITAARGLLRITLKELADAAGVSLDTISDWESGATTPRRATVEVIRRALEDRGIEFLNHGSPGVRLRPEFAHMLTQ